MVLYQRLFYDIRLVLLKST